jgi:glutamine synthetase
MKTNSYTEILRFIEDNDVKFVRLAFCDIFGNVKNMSILADELETAFTKGIRFYPCSVKGFDFTDEAELYLHPIASTIMLLPWRPRQSSVIRFFCEIRKADGSIFSCDTRHLLCEAMERAYRMGLTCDIGTDSEFYLFRQDEHGMPALEPFDQAGYLDVSPLDKCENIRREICLTLEEMGIHPFSSHHEQGPGQNEIDFKHSEGIAAADNFLNFKLVVKALAERNGLHATFMPKPLEGRSCSGLHMDIKLRSVDGREIAAERRLFTLGIYEKIREITAFLNPTINSYERLASFNNPKKITISKDRITSTIRIIEKEGEWKRLKLRSADSSCNPYLAFALILNAGLDAIQKGGEPQPAEELLKEESHYEFPGSLAEAMRIAKTSDFVNRIVTPELMAEYIKQADAATAYCDKAKDKYIAQRELYFIKV